eukprot:Platyproteum_vivax@DN1489_c0_g1_i1.p1
MGYTRYNSLCIFVDWDDTLFPTSEVRRLQMQTKSKAAATKALESANWLLRIQTFLSSLVRLGFTAIVTNSSRDWFTESMTYLKGMDGLIKDLNIEVLFSRDFCTEKPRTFEENVDCRVSTYEFGLKTLSMQGVSHADIVSVGDSPVDHEACRQVAEKKSDFVRNARCFELECVPSLETVSQQLEDVCSEIGYICSLDRPITTTIGSSQVGVETPFFNYLAATPPCTPSAYVLGQALLPPSPTSVGSVAELPQ